MQVQLAFRSLRFENGHWMQLVLDAGKYGMIINHDSINMALSPKKDIHEEEFLSWFWIYLISLYRVSPKEGHRNFES